jgi:ABC-type multidrug transport system permease subunit
MDLKKHLEKGWSNTVNFIGPVLLLTFVQFIVIFCSLGILAPVTTAGYFQSLLLAQREGRTPEIKDLFSQMSLFLPLFLFGLVVLIVVSIGFMLFVLPGFAATILLVFACMYMLPLMTDKELGLIDALKESWAMAVKDPIGDHIIIALVYMGILSIGGSIPFVILAAQPLATFILLSFYDERVTVTGVAEV